MMKQYAVHEVFPDIPTLHEFCVVLINPCAGMYDAAGYPVARFKPNQMQDAFDLAKALSDEVARDYGYLNYDDFCQTAFGQKTFLAS